MLRLSANWQDILGMSQLSRRLKMESNNLQESRTSSIQPRRKQHPRVCIRRLHN